MTWIHRHTSYKSTTLLPKQPEVEIHVTHPFSPLREHRFVLIERKQCWGEDRILCFDETGNYCRILTSWTDYAPLDIFQDTSNGRAYLSADSVIELAAHLENLVEILLT